MKKFLGIAVALVIFRIAESVGEMILFPFIVLLVVLV